MTDLHDHEPRLRHTRHRVHAFRDAARSGQDVTPTPTAPVSQPKELEVGATKLATKRSFTSDEADAIATELGIDFRRLGCDLEQFRMGLDVELEHGSRDPETDVSGNDRVVTGKIALAHLTEFPDYYTRLAVLEREAADHKSKRKQLNAVNEHRPIERKTVTKVGDGRGETMAKIRAPGIPHGDEELGGAMTGGVAGAVIGAVVGGPVGAVIGGAVGAASGAAAGAIDEKSKDDTVRR
jgi:hypothetical protein